MVKPQRLTLQPKATSPSSSEDLSIVTVASKDSFQGVTPFVSETRPTFSPPTSDGSDGRLRCVPDLIRGDDCAGESRCVELGIVCFLFFEGWPGRL
eukprot:3213937-Rhodomonas_salina.4